MSDTQISAAVLKVIEMVNFLGRFSAIGVPILFDFDREHVRSTVCGNVVVPVSEIVFDRLSKTELTCSVKQGLRIDCLGRHIWAYDYVRFSDRVPIGFQVVVDFDRGLIGQNGLTLVGQVATIDELAVQAICSCLSTSGMGQPDLSYVAANIRNQISIDTQSLGESVVVAIAGPLGQEYRYLKSPGGWDLVNVILMVTAYAPFYQPVEVIFEHGLRTIRFRFKDKKWKKVS